MTHGEIMKPAMSYSVYCPCGWELIENPKVVIDEYVKHHKKICEVWTR